MLVSCKANGVNGHSGSPAGLTSGRSGDGLCPAFPIWTLLSTPRHDLITPLSTLASVPGAVSRPFAYRCPADYSSHHLFQPHRWPEIMGGVEKWSGESQVEWAVSPLGQMQTLCWLVDFLLTRAVNLFGRLKSGITSENIWA